MTYCVAIKIKEGLIFASDSRTNAGIDNISVFAKLVVLKLPENGKFLLNAGNLGTTQEVVSLLRKKLSAELRIIFFSWIHYLMLRVGLAILSVKLLGVYHLLARELILDVLF